MKASTYLTEVIPMPGIRGQFITRSDCFAAFIAAGHDRATADTFAFTGQAVTEAAHPKGQAALTASLNGDVTAMRAELYA